MRRIRKIRSIKVWNEVRGYYSGLDEMGDCFCRPCPTSKILKARWTWFWEFPSKHRERSWKKFRKTQYKVG